MAHTLESLKRRRTRRRSNSLNGHELQLRAVLEWQQDSETYVTHYCPEGEGLGDVLPGTAIRIGSHTAAKSAPTGWQELPASLPPRASDARGKRRFLVVVEETEEPGRLGIESVLKEFSEKYRLASPTPATSNPENFQKQLQDHLIRLGLVNSPDDPLFRELRDNLMRGFAITLGTNLAAEKLMAAANGQGAPGDRAGGEKKAVASERLLKPPAAKLHVAKNFAENVQGESQSALVANWDILRIEVTERTGVLIPKIAVKVDFSLPADHMCLYLNGTPGQPFALPKSESGLHFLKTVRSALTLEASSRVVEVFTYEQALMTLASYKDSASYRTLVPGLLSEVSLWRVLRNLVREGVSIRNLTQILGCILVEATHENHPDALTEKVRVALRPLLLHSLRNEDRRDPVLWQLPDEFEEEILQSRPGAELLCQLSEVSLEFSVESRPLSVLTRPQVRRKFVELFPHARAFTVEELGAQYYQILRRPSL